MKHLLFGSLISQVLTGLTGLLLVYIYSPEVLGQYFLVITIANFLTPLFTWRHELYLGSIENDNEAQEVFYEITLRIIKSTYLFFFALCVVNVLEVIGIFPFTFKYYFYSVPFISGIYSFSSLVNQNTIRLREYRKLALGSVSQNFTISSLQLLGGLIFAKTLTLVSSEIIGRLIGAYVSLGKGYFKYRKILVKNRKRFRNRDAIPLIGNTLDLACESILIFIITFLYGHTVLAYFVIANRILGSATTVIGGTFAKYFQGEITNLLQTRNAFFRNHTDILIKNFCILGIFTYLSLIFSVNFINNSGYLGSLHNYLHILNGISYFFLINLLWSGLSNYLIPMKRFKTFMLMNLTRICFVGFGGVLVSLIGVSAYQGIIIIVGFYSFPNLIFFLYTLKDYLNFRLRVSD